MGRSEQRSVALRGTAAQPLYYAQVHMSNYPQAFIQSMQCKVQSISRISVFLNSISSFLRIARLFETPQ